MPTISGVFLLSCNTYVVNECECILYQISDKLHSNMVLNLFETQEFRFAIPFAAYRASIVEWPRHSVLTS